MMALLPAPCIILCVQTRTGGGRPAKVRGAARMDKRRAKYLHRGADSSTRNDGEGQAGRGRILQTHLENVVGTKGGG